MGLRKHHYEQGWWKWWNSSWAISNPEIWCYEISALNMPANLENSAVATGLEKASFDSNPKEKQCQRMFKLPHNALISHASKVMLKILQAWLQHCVTCELPGVQAGFRKGKGTRDHIANFRWIIKKAKKFQENICLYQSLWLCGSQQTGKFFKRWNTRPAWPEKSVCRSRSNS